MAKTLQEYAAWLDERERLWPAAPTPVVPKCTPYLKPLPDVRGVAWSVYGVLLFISDGKLLHQHPDPLRMQVALDKTIQEFNMWNSMSRKPGAPWQYMLQQYTRIVEDMQLAASPRKGETPEINSAEVWRQLIERLGKKEYTWDEDLYGDLEEFSEKVAYFFHSCLQGAGPAPGALSALEAVAFGGFNQGAVGDMQCFTMVQLLRALRTQGAVAQLPDLFSPGCLSASHLKGVRQPARTLFETCVQQFTRHGLDPHEILFVGARLKDEVAVAKQLGLRTALYAGDKLHMQASHAELQQPELRPDRILSDLGQIRQLLGLTSSEPTMAE